MPVVTPPEQQQLDATEFPKDKYWGVLIKTLNKFILQTVAGLSVAGDRFVVLPFKTGASVADSFPIDIAVQGLPPKWVSVAQLAPLPADLTSPVYVHWELLSNGFLRIKYITGLDDVSSYVVTLVLR